MKVAIVGGGLVGRLAAWATMLAGHTPTIIDKERYAVAPRGFFYLHDNCSLPLTPQAIQVYETGGSPSDYAMKVYGDLNTDVSFGKILGQVNGYDPAEALNILNGLQDGFVSYADIEDFETDVLPLRDTHDKVIFTLPVNKFIPGTWKARAGSVEVFKLDDGEDLQNFCVYSADPNISWHRAGAMFGWAFREFADEGPELPSQTKRRIFKVTGGSSSVPAKLYENLLFTGRFGTWSKQLAHESFEQVFKWLAPEEKS